MTKVPFSSPHLQYITTRYTRFWNLVSKCIYHKTRCFWRSTVWNKERKIVRPDFKFNFRPFLTFFWLQSISLVDVKTRPFTAVLHGASHLKIWRNITKAKRKKEPKAYKELYPTNLSLESRWKRRPFVRTSSYLIQLVFLSFFWQKPLVACARRFGLVRRRRRRREKKGKLKNGEMHKMKSKYGSLGL